MGREKQELLEVSKAKWVGDKLTSMSYAPRDMTCRALTTTTRYNFILPVKCILSADNSPETKLRLLTHINMHADSSKKVPMDNNV